MHMTVLKLLFLIIPWFPACLSDDNAELNLFDENEARSRLLMVNGNMYFHAGKGKNISFVTNQGGSIFLAQTDISTLPSLASFSDLSEQVNLMKEDYAVMKNRVDGANRHIVTFINISRNIVAVTRNISSDVKMLREWKKDRNSKDVKLRKYLTRIAKGIKSLVETLKFNGCDEKPCEGGATCIPQMGKKVFCLCPPHRTGDHCEEDVNECEMYEHDQTCQNNGTCENIDGGFLCHCPIGFHGPLCQFKQSSCRRNPGLCGHGHCIESAEGDVSDYKCICEPGYKISSDPENPTCIDINECLTSPCHPGVDCINLPGSFQCSGCPKGFHGNGQNCADIDECSQPNYPCSQTPKAQCFNTIGSYHCGPCPAGYRGDGRSCRRFSACAGRPCHPQATCQDDIDNTNAGGFVCHCPDGFLGDGIGQAGCRKGNATVCKLGGRCLNGATCKAVTEDSYLCLCPEGYFGSRCEKVSECISAPCKNGATCQYDVTNGYTCICPPGFYGHDCELEEDSCGLHFTEREGNASFPGNFDLSTGTMCDLVIAPQLANNEALRITFTLFTDMEAVVGGPTNCKTTVGNLTLFDGDNDNSNVFAVFCGSSANPKAPLIGSPITMTGSRAMLRFAGTKGRYEIQWELKKRECGYRTSVPAGSLVIPSHFQNFSCEWFLSAGMTQVVEITIPPVRLGTEERNCSVNQLEIYDGYTVYAAHRVIHFCSSVNETVTVRSTGPFLSVMFTNDLLYGSNSQLPGFQMTYKFVEPDHSCGGTFKNPDGNWDFSGEITTPNWGGLYPPDSHCTWLIDGTGAPDDSDGTNATALTAMHSLKLEFTDFDVPSPFVFSLDRATLSLWNTRVTMRGRRPIFRSLIKCTQDSLNIFSDGNLVFDGCNPHRPPSSLLIPEGKAIVQFKSDAKTQGKGFRMKYSLVCEKRLFGNGTIQTWNYPDGGTKGKCTYIISADSTHAIILKVKTIGLKVFNTATCFYSKSIPADVEDYVKISGGREDDKPLNSKYICAKFPFVEEGEFIVSASRPLTIEYSSSGHTENKGLLLEYSTIDVGCGGFYSQSNGVVNSPNYPNKYMPHMHCVYHVNVPWSKQVRLTFDNFDLEVVQNDECNYDRVEIYDRYVSESNHGKLLGKFCGTMTPPSILSPTYSMSLVFVSDRSIAGNGFSARFESVDQTVDCDRTFTAPSGIIEFDSSKGRFGECVFHIALPTNSKILLSVLNMSLPCSKGALQIKNGVSDQAPGFAQLWRESEICNEHPLETTLRTHGSRMYIKLTLLDPTNVTFNLSYESITQNCGGRVTGVSGTIATPQYPEKDSRTMQCEWNVAVAPGNKVSFQLAMVDDLRSSDDNGFCGIFAANRIDVYDGPEAGAPLLRRFCRKTYGADAVISDDHEMLVKYRQQGGINVGALFGFMAHYTTVCRDIVFTDFTGTIQSPGYPDNVYTNRYCSWTIKVPPGNRIRLYFVEYTMDQVVPYFKRNCDNFIKFGDGEVAEARYMINNNINVTNSFSDTCGNKRPIEIKSANNSISLTFQSKKKEENKFWLTWTTIGCGGELINPANITVKQDSLDRNSDVYECYWKITAPIGKKIQFRINELLIFRPDLGATCEYNNTGYSGVQAFSGLNNVSGFPQDKMCQATKDGYVFTSHSNEMFVMMKVQRKHVATNDNFFSAKVTFIDTNLSEADDCSAIIEVPLNSNRTITSPRFPKEYPKDAHCHWIFKAPPGHHLRFVLKEYITPNSHPQNTAMKGWNMASTNLTCKHPMQLIEGALTVHLGNTSRSAVIDRVCQDITEEMIFDVPSQTSLVSFTGASAPRSYQSGESEKDKRVGFVMEAMSECGGLQYATSEEMFLKFFDMPISVCNITIRKMDPSDSGVYIRLDEYFLKNQVSQFHRRTSEFGTDAIEVSVDGGEPQVRPLFMSMMMGTFPSTHEEFRGTNEIKISIAKRSSLLAPQIMIAYSTDIESCGAALDSRQGLIKTSKLKEDSECIWTVKNSPGNRVQVVIGGLYLPPSENCVESYVEVREYNESGKVLGRFCGAERPEYQAQSLWIKLRYIKPDQDDSDMDDILNEEEGAEQLEPYLRFRYSHINGGVINTPGPIQNPTTPAGSTVEYKLVGEQDKGILIEFDELNFPNYNPGDSVYMPSGLYFMEADTKFFAVIGKMRDMLLSGSKLAITGFTPPKELYLPFSNAILYAVGMHDKNVAFKLRWSIVDLRSAEELNGTAVEENKYSCGGNLIPTWNWQTLKSPSRADGGSGYDSDLHCMWSMTRPMLKGLQVQIVKMDLEDMTSCPYDYFAVVANEEREDLTEEERLEKAHKLCKRESENVTFSYNYNRKLNLHFVTDRSRGGSGFEVRYRLSCNAFDFVRKNYGFFSHQLTSPGFPDQALATDCSWALVLESNRRIAVTINNLTLPIPPCKDSYISVHARSIGALVSSVASESRICGAIDSTNPRNFTIPHGRLFIRYFDKKLENPTGFKLKIEEIIETCSEVLYVDENTPNRTFYSPLWPQLLPNSLDCDYVIRAPAGHRLQFTVDPIGFRMEASDNETCYCDSCDYLEVRDGSTESSPLIGRYCDIRPPSTITSTGSFLYVKLKTDSYAKSAAFKAVYKMAECGGTVILNPNKPTLLTSPNFPNAYPMQTECQWAIYSPNSHFINMTLNHMWLSWTPNCTTDRLTIMDGNASAPYLLEPACNPGRLEKLDYRSSSSRATVGFVANSSIQRNGRGFCRDKKCGFELELKVSDQGCGGIINNNQGVITAPGYPNRLLPHVQCRWDLQAGIGYRYLLEFEFTDPIRNGFYQQRYDSNTFTKSRACFMDMHFFNGRFQQNNPNMLSHRYFCEKELTYLTEADIATVMYSDLTTRDTLSVSQNAVEDQFYVPFRLNYTRVPAHIDTRGCSYKVTSNTTINMNSYAKLNNSVNEAHYCHVVINRPPEYATTVIRIQDYTDMQASYNRECTNWGSYIEIMSEEDDDVRDVYERMCNATFMGITREIRREYLNVDLHIHVSTILSLFSQEGAQAFNLSIEFYECGGIINGEPNNGFLESPNYGIGPYFPNQDCVWQLRAPEGQVIWINITDIDVEQHVQCDHDVLIIGEGKDNSIIHRYCNPDNQFGNVSDQLALQERHRTFRTISRYLTFTWHTDYNNEGRGFKIEYEFVDVGDGCGFTTHAMTGVAHSTNFPKDYPNDEECIWDIQVPVGYHINVIFTHFDVEASEGCVNDYLQISEEHSARANDPLGDYYFLFQDEEKSEPYCGIMTPKKFESTSNRVRLNFTTNSRVNAKGFRAEWNAVCGAVFQLSHYAIVSPLYPSHYPNEDMSCSYLIEPTEDHAKSVVVVKVLDMDLSPVQIEIGRYPCEADYVEVVDVMQERVVASYCGGKPYISEPIAVRGPVAIRMSINRTFVHGPYKLHRGFQFSYAMQRCGGEYQMMEENEFMVPISSPAFPLDYPHDLDCVWNITTTGDRVFAIKFLMMDIEATAGCDMDWVEMYDGAEMNNKTKIGQYCGTNKDMPQQLVRTQGNEMVIRFVSDRSMSSGGFKLIVTATLGPKHGCGGKLESKAEWSSLSPPMKDDSYYNNLHCGWTITGPEKTMLEFRLNSMDTEKLHPVPGEQSGPRCIDELMIYDGYKAFSPMLAGDLCSETVPALPAYYHSSHRVAHVHFESDGSGGGKGFELQYRSIAPDCGDWFTARETVQTLAFEAKPKSAASTGQSVQRCQWVIQTDSQTPMEIHLKKLNFPSPDGNCDDAYIEIRDVGSIAKCQHPACAGHESEKKVIKYCGDVTAAPFISNTMAVQITTSAIITNDKHASFSLDYQLLPACNRTIDASEIKSGRVTSPNYPNPYDHNTTCTTTIKAAPNHLVMLAFRQFRIEMGRPVFFAPNNTRRYNMERLSYRIFTCDHDYLQIYEKVNLNKTKQHCGSGLPKTYFSSGNELSLFFQTDYSVAGEGFDASYYTTKYSSVTRTYNFAPIHEATGAFTSVGYPFGYNASTTQKWSIIPPTGQNCEFEIVTLSLAVRQQGVDCASMDEYLMIENKGIEGPNDVVSQRIRGCSHMSHMKFTLMPGAYREIAFTFKSDAVTGNDGIGVRVVWSCHLGSMD